MSDNSMGEWIASAPAHRPTRPATAALASISSAVARLNIEAAVDDAVRGVVRQRLEAPPARESATGSEVDPRGRGNVLVKVGGPPGILVHIALAETELSQLIDDFDLSTTSVSHGRGGRSTNRAVRRERVLDVADLQAMPKGRAVAFAFGAPAALVRTLPSMAGPHAAAVRASIAKHDPAADVTIAEAMNSLTDVEAQEQAVLPA